MPTIRSSGEKLERGGGDKRESERERERISRKREHYRKRYHYCDYWLEEMTSLADAFLADFDDDEEEELPPLEPGSHALATGTTAAANTDAVFGALDEATSSSVKMEIEGADVSSGKKDADVSLSKQPKKRVADLTKLLHDPTLAAHIRATEVASSDSNRDGSSYTRGEEYDLIVASNQYISQIEDEANAVFLLVKDIFQTRFKDLDSIVPNPVDYVKVVRLIGNKTDVTDIDFTSTLPQTAILTLTVTASTSMGGALSVEELERVNEACDAVVSLVQMREQLLAYVESRMEYIAPNLSAIVGPPIAAIMIGLTKGLENLAGMPSCNIQVLGQETKHLHGFSSRASEMHMGVLLSTDILQNTPNEFKRKALRITAGRCALAARADTHADGSGAALGRKFREEIDAKIQKWQEPPPPKLHKALPTPDEPKKKKRGGRRYRKMREQQRMSQLQKDRSRMKFGEEELVDEYTGESFGMIGQQSNTGRIRVQQKQTKLAKRKAAQMQKDSSAAKGGDLTSLGQKESRKAKLKKLRDSAAGRIGSVSTISFTPVDGMELVNPNAEKERLAQASNKYFSSTSSFIAVGSTTKKEPARSLPPVPKFE